MATSVTQSLFGMTPQSIQAQRDADLQRQALQFAQLTPMQQAQMGLFTAGSQLGTGIAQALGAEDPEMAQARARQGLLGGLDMSNPQALREAARMADPATAQMLINQALDIEKQLADVGAREAQARKVDADLLGQQTAFQNRFAALKSRFPNISDEEARAVAGSETAFNNVFKDQQAKLSSFAQQLVDEGLQPGTPEFQSRMRQYNQKQANKKSLEETLGTGLAGLAAAMAGPRAEKAAGAEGTEVGKATAQIQGKFDALTSLRTAESLLKDAQGNYKIYAGLFGPEETIVAKATKGLLGDRDKAINTEQFMAEISTTVIPLLQEFGGNDSNEELRFLQRVVGGDQRLEPEAIERIIKSAQRKIERGIKRVQQQQQATQAGQPLPTQPIEATSNAVDFSTLKRK